MRHGTAISDGVRDQSLSPPTTAATAASAPSGRSPTGPPPDDPHACPPGWACGDLWTHALDGQAVLEVHLRRLEGRLSATARREVIESNLTLLEPLVASLRHRLAVDRPGGDGPPMADDSAADDRDHCRTDPPDTLREDPPVSARPLAGARS